MQAGLPSNIMKELGFSSNQYNLVATIQGVRTSSSTLFHIPITSWTPKVKYENVVS